MKLNVFFIFLAVFYCLVSPLKVHACIITPSYDNVTELKGLARQSLLSGSADSAVVYYWYAIEEAREHRNGGRGVDGTLVAEYAYALALHHDYEAALINIDRARALNTKYGDFYAAQVLTIMGHTSAANELLKDASMPRWLDGDYLQLTSSFASEKPVYINQDPPQQALERANRLAATKQTIQSIAIFEELMELYPAYYVIKVDYSSVWESINHYGYAKQLLRLGINTMPNDTTLIEMRSTFTEHLALLHRQDSASSNKTLSQLIIGKGSPKFMTYIGASMAGKVYALNGRLGVFTSQQFSASLNMGLNYSKGSLTGDLGLSAYKTWCVFVVGLGISDHITAHGNEIGLTPAAGFSFINKAQTSSFDIMFNVFLPITSKARTSFSMSLGKTYYIDIKKQKQ